ncbi:translocation/assembly module TamB domain-containing protein [bacterium]|nr:translocation/assembly module TamB domain-containing protein [bacterium]
MRALWIIILVFLLGGIIAWKGEEYLESRLEAFLRKEFSEGTNCAVDLKNPSISLLPLTAEIQDVSIVCPGETQGEGFFVKKIKAYASLWELSEKIIRLSNLELAGARIKSDRLDSALIRTLEFILNDPPNPQPDRWKLKVNDVYIDTPETPGPHLWVRAGNFRFIWDQVKFHAHIPPGIPPSELRASSNMFAVERVAAKRIALGKFKGFVDVGGGLLRVHEVEVQHGEKADISRVKGTSRILLPGSYDLDFDTNLTGDFFAQFGADIGIDRLRYQAKMSGALEAPIWQGNTVLTFLEKDSQCLPKELGAKLSIGMDGLKLSESQYNREKFDFNFNLSFAEPFGISARLPLGQRQLENCLAGVGQEIRWNNIRALSINGTLSPLLLRAQAEGLSGFAMKLASEQSGKILLDLEHHAQRENSPGTESVIKARANFQQAHLTVEQIDAINYPLTTLFKTATVLFDRKFLEVAEYFEGAVINGTYDPGRHEGQFQINKFTKLPAEAKVDFKLAVAANAIKIPDLKLSTKAGEIAAKFIFPLDAATPGEVLVRTSSYPLNSLVNDPLGYAGVFDVGLNYNFKRGAELLGNGEFNFTADQMKIAGVEIAFERSISSKIQSGKLILSPTNIVVDNHPVKLSGSADFDTGPLFNVVGELDLSTIKAQIPQLRTASGDIKFDFNTAGTWRALKLNGSMSLTDGTIVLPSTTGGIEISEINLNGKFSDDNLLLENIKGLVGDGAISGSGIVKAVTNNTARKVEVKLVSDGITLMPIVGLEMEVSGDLLLRKDGITPLDLSGKIQLQRSSYVNNFDITTVLKRAQQVLAGTAESQQAGISSTATLNLQIQAPNSQYVETNVFTGELAGDLLAQGTLKSPSLKGDIRVIDGAVRFQTNDFTVLHGLLRFPEAAQGIRPTIDLVSEAFVRSISGDEYPVRLIISGPVERPSVKINSSSNLSERELLSMMSLGGRIEELSLLKSTAKSPRSSDHEIISADTELSFRDRLSAITGFSEVQIETGTSTITGEFVPVLRAARPFIGDTEIVVRSELDAERATIGTIEYPLNPALSAVAGWKTHSVTDPSNNSGSASIGLTFQKRFQGTSIFPNQE